MATHTIHSRMAAGRADLGSVLTTDPGAIGAYLEDAARSPGGHAAGVAHPRSEADVAELLRSGVRVLPVGSQSSLTGGATPFGETVLATDGLDQVLQIGRSEVRAQVGVALSALQAALDAHGACYPPVPTFDGATVGGVVATNAAGASTFKYGTTRDWVRGLTVVLADGTVLDLHRGEVEAHVDGFFDVVQSDGAHRVRIPTYEMPDVPKRSAGYFARPGMDLVDLFVGSEGTLGIITEVTLRILPRQPIVCVVWLPMREERRAVELVATLREAARLTWLTHDPRGLDVAAIEHLDRRSLDILRDDGADRLHHVAIPPDSEVGLLIQIELPEGVVATTADAYAQVEVALDPGAADTPLTRLCQMLASAGVLDRAEIAFPLDHRRKSQLLALREAVPEGVNRRIGEAKRLHPSIRKTAADMIVPFARFDESLTLFRSTFAGYGLDYAIWGHISDGNLHPNVIAGAVEDVSKGESAILACGRGIIEMGGCPLAEHGVGRHPVKQTLLRMLYGDRGLAEMRQVKEALDPASRLAPGVLFPVTR